jgi:hypothetical protein
VSSDQEQDTDAEQFFLAETVPGIARRHQRADQVLARLLDQVGQVTGRAFIAAIPSWGDSSSDRPFWAILIVDEIHISHSEKHFDKQTL